MPIATRHTSKPARTTAQITSAEPKPMTKKAKRAEQDFLIGCTADERAYSVRLVRLLRDNYWVSDLVRQILNLEARAKNQLTLKKVRAMLENIDTIEALANNARHLGPDWSHHPILQAIREEWKDIQDYKDERAISDLIESARR